MHDVTVSAGEHKEMLESTDRGRETCGIFLGFEVTRDAGKD